MVCPHCVAFRPEDGESRRILNIFQGLIQFLVRWRWLGWSPVCARWKRCVSLLAELKQGRAGRCPRSHTRVSHQEIPSILPLHACPSHLALALLTSPPHEDDLYMWMRPGPSPARRAAMRRPWGRRAPQYVSHSCFLSLQAFTVLTTTSFVNPTAAPCHT